MISAEEILLSVTRALEKENYYKDPQELYDPINYILSLGGKRIRPVLLLMTVDMYGGDMDLAMPAALGLEIFHNFSLVHDDIMDRAPIRRGKATVHEKWDANAAILSGDTMMVKAYDQFMKLPDQWLRPVLEIFNHTATGVCEGQQLDMNFEERTDVTLAEYMEMIRLKTGVLIGAAFRMGSLLAGASKAEQDELYHFGIHTGLVFQLRDDLLDTYGDEHVFGKKQYGDIRANKKTFLYLKALENLAGEDRIHLQKLYSDPSVKNNAKIAEVLDCFDKADVKNEAEIKINEHFLLAKEALNALKVDEERKELIKSYTEQLVGRKY